MVRVSVRVRLKGTSVAVASVLALETGEPQIVWCSMPRTLPLESVDPKYGEFGAVSIQQNGASSGISSRYT